MGDSAPIDEVEGEAIGYWANEPSRFVEVRKGVYAVEGGPFGTRKDLSEGRRGIYAYFREKPMLLEHGYTPINLTPEAARTYLAGEEVQGLEGGKRPVWIRKDRERHY